MYLQWFQGSSQPLGNAFHCEPKMTRVFSHAFSFSTAIGIWYSFYECIYHIGSLASTKTRGFFAPKAGCESGNALLAHLRVASQIVPGFFTARKCWVKIHLRSGIVGDFPTGNNIKQSHFQDFGSDEKL